MPDWRLEQLFNLRMAPDPQPTLTVEMIQQAIDEVAGRPTPRRVLVAPPGLKDDFEAMAPQLRRELNIVEIRESEHVPSGQVIVMLHPDEITPMTFPWPMLPHPVPEPPQQRPLTDFIGY